MLLVLSMLVLWVREVCWFNLACFRCVCVFFFPWFTNFFCLGGCWGCWCVVGVVDVSVGVVVGRVGVGGLVVYLACFWCVYFLFVYLLGLPTFCLFGWVSVWFVCLLVLVLLMLLMLLLLC